MYSRKQIIFQINLLVLYESYIESESEICSVMSDSNSPGQNTGMGSLSLLQGIFPTQGLNPGLLHSRQILYQLSHKRSPRILEWVGYSFSLGSSWPMNPTGITCIAGKFFTNWATREGLLFCEFYINNSLKMLTIFRTPRMLFFIN